MTSKEITNWRRNTWAFAWVSDGPHPGSKPLPEPYIVSVHHTRWAAWSWILDVWFRKVPNLGDAYTRTGKRYVNRAAAIAYLKRRGGRVIRVNVTPV